jgi:6-phosphogluconolactonase
VTLTMPVILGARFVALHIEGEAKRSVLDKALKAGDANAMPIRHVLRGRPAMPVYWAP